MDSFDSSCNYTFALRGLQFEAVEERREALSYLLALQLVVQALRAARQNQALLLQFHNLHLRSHIFFLVHILLFLFFGVIEVIEVNGVNDISSAADIAR